MENATSACMQRNKRHAGKPNEDKFDKPRTSMRRMKKRKNNASSNRNVGKNTSHD